MSINNYSNPIGSHNTNGKVIQQIFNAKGSVNMDQLHGLNNPYNGEEDGYLNILEFGLDPKQVNQTENTEQTNFDLFNHPDGIDINLNQDSYGSTNDDEENDQPSNPEKENKTDTDTQDKILTYVIPPSLRRPFQIPYPKQTTKTVLPSNAFTTPNTGKTITKYDRVLHMTSTTLVNATTDNEANSVEIRTTHQTITENPNTATTELRLAQTSLPNDSARQPVLNPVQGTVEKSTTDNSLFYEHLNPYARGNGKTSSDDNRQKTPDSNETQTATTVNHVTPLIAKNIATPILNNRVQLISNSVLHNPQPGNLNNITTRDLFNPYARGYTNLFISDERDHNNNTSSNQEHNNDICHLSLEKPALPAPVNATITGDHTLNPQQPLPMLTAQQPMRANYKNTEHKNSGKLHVSKFIDDSMKPTDSSKIILPPDLETLRPLIMSQPEALAPYIIELGTNNLTHSRIINKKKESFTQLASNNKTPRSLRIKCELTTSPSYSSHPSFLQIKERLHNATNDYIKTGTMLMAEWAHIHISLLTHDRCHSLLTKALKILDGITFYNATVIFTPTWFSASQNHNTLLLLKFYLSNSFIDTNEIVTYLELPTDTILLIGAKILSNHGSDAHAANSINAINLTDINLAIKEEFDFISETLISFDQILRLTTIDLWHAQQEKTKQLSAAITLKSRMAAFETTDATASTAAAITRATELQAETEATTLQTSLRIANLEKTTRKQEQKVNEFSKLLRHNDKKQRHSNMIDLTTDDGKSPQPSSSSPTPFPKSQRNLKRKQNDFILSPPFTKRSNKPKKVHWNIPEQLQINPVNTVNTQPPNYAAAPPMPLNSNTPFFAPAPPPVPPQAPSASNPFVGRQMSPFTAAKDPYTNGNPITKNPFHNVSHNKIGSYQDKIIKPKRDKHNTKGRRKRN